MSNHMTRWIEDAEARRYTDTVKPSVRGKPLHASRRYNREDAVVVAPPRMVVRRWRPRTTVSVKRHSFHSWLPPEFLTSSGECSPYTLIIPILSAAISLGSALSWRNSS
jgi:hypothetical protein